MGWAKISSTTILQCVVLYSQLTARSVILPAATALSLPHHNTNRATTTSNAYTSRMPSTLSQHPLILGSGSFTRKLILKNMGVDFVVIKRPIDERGLGDRTKDTPEQLVQQLAHAKMDHLLQEIANGSCRDELPECGTDNDEDDWIVMTADQVVTCEGKILEKPDTIEQAKAFVGRYGQSPCTTVGAVVLAHLPSQTRVSQLHLATVHFRPTLTASAAVQLVDDLLADNAPILSCAGGLMVEHPLTKQHIDRIEGSEESVMGLCKETVLDLFQEMENKLKV